MKFSSIVILALATLTSSAPLERRRFAQEQEVGLQAKISAVSEGCPGNGDPSLGFGGQEIGTLLAAANPCNKLTLADQIVIKAKTCPPDVASKIISIAMELVAAEKNFNPFNGNLDSVCLTPGLPASVELQGILQKVDPRNAPPNNNDAAIASAAAALNAKAAQVLASAQSSGSGPGSGGKSMAQLLADNGFTAIQNFNGAGNGGGNVGNQGNQQNNNQNGNQVGNQQKNNQNGNQGGNQGNNNNNAGVVTGATGCNAQKAEVVVRGNEQRFGLNGQQVALNPAIVLERICNALRDATCKAACLTAKAAAEATGVRGNSQGQGDLQAMQKLVDDFNRALA